MAFGFPANYSDKRKHLIQKELADKLAIEVLQEMNCMDFGYHKEAIDYKTQGSSMLSLGERMLVYTGKTEILVKSECLNPAQFLDFGKNKSNVLQFFNLFEEKVKELPNSQL